MNGLRIRLASWCLAASLGLAAPAFAQIATASRTGEPPDRLQVFVARKVVTMDPSLPEATAVLVGDGKIVSVGRLEDFKPWLDRHPYDVDRRFAADVIYPGFVEAHGHPLIGGTTLSCPPLTYLPLPSPYGPAFPGVKNLDAVKARLKEYEAAIADPRTPLLAWGYDMAAMGKPLDKAYLDGVSTTRAIIVWDASEHNTFANSATLQRYGITADAARKIQGARIGPDGEPTGQFFGVVATSYLFQLAGKDLFTPEATLRHMQYLNDLAQQAGVTTMSELDFGSLDIAMEEQVFRKFVTSPMVSQRLVVVVNGLNFVAAYKDQAIARAKELRRLNDDRLTFDGVKFFSDDAYLSDTMMVANPGYTDGHEGVIFNPTPQAFADAMFPWWDAGFHIHVHTNGNVGNAYTLAALQDLQERKPRFDHRFTLQHYGLTTSMMARKVKALGAVVSTNPTYVYARADIQQDQLGVDRAASASRIGTLLKEGVIVSLHADTPVAPPLPLTEVWIAVNRIGLLSGTTHAPAERVPVDRAIRMVTIDAAYTLGMEDRVGSIEPGKLADFVVLGDDPRTVAPMAIKDISVIATVLGGKTTMTTETRHRRPLF